MLNEYVAVPSNNIICVIGPSNILIATVVKKFFKSIVTLHISINLNLLEQWFESMDQVGLVELQTQETLSFAGWFIFKL